jgi:drug/metabolite transporter superfamily protein YnfA
MLSVAALAMLCGCYSYKENQVQMKSAELIRIDTISRYDRQEQVLTWKSQDNMFYTSYAALGPVFIVGSKVTVFVQR